MRLLITLLLLLPSMVFSQFNIDVDVTTLTKEQYRDSASVRKLIDSVFQYKQHNLTNASALADFCIEQAREISNLSLEGGALNLKATIYKQKGETQQALSTNLQALKIFEATGNSYSTAMALNNIASIYTSLGKWTEAMRYLTEAEQLAIKHGHEMVLLYVYGNHVTCLTQMQDFPKALGYALKVDSITARNKLDAERANNLNTIGAIHFYQNNFPAALQYYNLSKAVAAQGRDSATLMRAVINIGEVHETTGKEDPLPYYKQGFDFFKRLQDHVTVHYVATNLVNYYRKKGDYANALAYYEIAVKEDAVNTNLQTKKALAELETKYQTEKKVQQIEILNKQSEIQQLSINKQRTTIAVIVVLLVLVVVSAAFIIMRHRYRQQAVLKERELKQRNELTAAVLAAEETERKRIAADLHDGIGQLFSVVKMNLNGLFERTAIDKTEHKFMAERTMALVDESCRELRAISHQMMPDNRAQSGIVADINNFIGNMDKEKLSVAFEAVGFTERLDSNEEIILYRVIQESVNNVIKHANASELKIYLEKNNSEIKAVIKDNGRGFDASHPRATDGIGLKNIKARIQYLNGNVKFASVPGTGTEISINVPLA